MSPSHNWRHALQAAHFASQQDAKHEKIGEVWLAQRFGPEVYEPGRLHVSAKRYLCTTDPNYFSRLSPASVQSLRLQGGPMSPDEIAAFESNRYFREAVRLRHWDDEAKVPGLPTADLAHYRNLIEDGSVSKE